MFDESPWPASWTLKPWEHETATGQCIWRVYADYINLCRPMHPVGIGGLHKCLPAEWILNVCWPAYFLCRLQILDQIGKHHFISLNNYLQTSYFTEGCFVDKVGWGNPWLSKFCNFREIYHLLSTLSLCMFLRIKKQKNFNLLFLS